MDTGFSILFFSICGVVALWILLRDSAKRNRQRIEDHRLLRELTARVFSLEEKVAKLSAAKPAAPVADAKPAGREAPPVPPKPVPEPKPAEILPVTATVKAPASQPPLQKPAPPPPRMPAAVPSSAGSPVAPPTTKPQPTAPMFQSVAQPPARPLGERAKSLLDVEQTLGTNWFGKIGTVLLVIGVVFLLKTYFPTSPLGRVLVGCAVATVLLGGGVWLELKDRYRILARAGIGGGWALFFFLSWAVHYIPATLIVDSAAVDLVLMLATAAVMVWHTLRYRSQAVTGLAFLLAFLSLGIGVTDGSISSATCLTAGVLLAASLVVIVGRMQWYELEIMGIAASYLNHFLWLRPIIEPMQGRHHEFPALLPSTAILILYWLIFRLSYVFRAPRDQSKERASSLAALLNPALLLTLLKYQSVHREWAFWGLLAIGALEIMFGQLPVTRRRRSAVIVLSTLGVVLLVAAFPVRYSGTSLSVLWLMEAEALLLVGVSTREIVFRRLGLLTSLLVAGHLLVTDGYSAFLARSVTTFSSASLTTALVFAVAALLFYGNAHIIGRRWKDLFSHSFDDWLVRHLSYVAGLMATSAAWLAFPDTWTAVAWCALGAALALAGRRVAASQLTYQAHLLATLAVLRTFAVNFSAGQSYGGFTSRMITVSLVAALLYATSSWSWPAQAGKSSAVRRLASAGYTWAGTVLLTVLVWYEVRDSAVAVVWALGSLALALVARRFANRDLTYQANAVALAAFIRTLAFNYTAVARYHGFTYRLISVITVAALLYVISRWSWAEESGERTFFLGAYSFPFSSVASGTYIWAGSFLLSLLAWYELEPVSVAVAWVVGGLLLFELGLARKLISLRMQAYVAFLGAFARIFFVNLNAGGEGVSPRLYTVAPIALAFFYAYWRLQENSAQITAAERNLKSAEFCCWLGTVTVAALVRFELPPDWVAAGWAGLALLLVAAAWLGRRRVFLHQALLLSFGILFRTVLHNFYQRSNFPPLGLWQSRWVLVGSTVALLLLSLPLLFKLRVKAANLTEGAPRNPLAALGRRPEQVFFFIAIALLTVMLALEMSHGKITLSWGIEGVAIFLLALVAGERSFRLTGLALLLLCVAKILFKDVWLLGPGDRYVTLIVLGAALLLVSFLYTRYREAIVRYL